MLKGFKDFLMRGNVVDLAVAVVIGTAFAAVPRRTGSPTGSGRPDRSAPARRQAGAGRA